MLGDRQPRRARGSLRAGPTARGGAARAKLFDAMLLLVARHGLQLPGRGARPARRRSFRTRRCRIPTASRSCPMFKGRDGCRTPMPWDDREPNGGFTTGCPWLPVPREHDSLSVRRAAWRPGVGPERVPRVPALAARRSCASQRRHPPVRVGGRHARLRARACGHLRPRLFQLRRARARDPDPAAREPGAAHRARIRAVLTRAGRGGSAGVRRILRDPS